MKTITVTFTERNKTKVLTAPLIEIGLSAITLAPHDKNGSSFIKRIKKTNVINYRIAE